jgi:hypothetical protein
VSSSEIVITTAIVTEDKKEDDATGAPSPADTWTNYVIP